MSAVRSFLSAVNAAYIVGATASIERGQRAKRPNPPLMSCTLEELVAGALWEVVLHPFSSFFIWPVGRSHERPTALGYRRVRCHLCFFLNQPGEGKSDAIPKRQLLTQITRL